MMGVKFVSACCKVPYLSQLRYNCISQEAKLYRIELLVFVGCKNFNLISLLYASLNKSTGNYFLSPLTSPRLLAGKLRIELTKVDLAVSSLKYAVCTGLEPVTFGVTGRHSSQLN